ncbi:MAG: alkyl/aryl-sulfatase [Opitutales bacterium]
MKKTILFTMIAISSLNLVAHEHCETPETQTLRNQAKEFERSIVKVADNVSVALGYDASNVTMIEGENGSILVDAGMIPSITAQIYADFKKISTKPIVAIILTHGHGDHTMGISSFLKENENVRIFARENFGIENEFAAKVGYKNPRGYKQAGMKLPPEQRINNGVAPVVYAPSGKYESDKNAKQANVYAPFSKKLITDIIDHKQRVTIEGIELELIPADGETADHLLVYYPQKSILFSGDMIYKSFPNLYAIRGTNYRDVNNWIQALNLMLEYNAKDLIMGHTAPIIGKANVEKALTNYRDAIEYVFKKTIEGMNKSMKPDELVEYVKLPEHLATDPYLGEYYGRVDWAVRNIHNGYLGWFDGNVANLIPLAKQEEALNWAKALGGVEKLYELAQSAIGEKNYQWCIELGDRLLAIDSNNQAYKDLMAQALRLKADNTLNATARNYYRTTARQLLGELPTDFELSGHAH